ncbi:MAG: hypothetical protein IJ904_03830 [Candidatus Methanomethylophilaceae archaeon]|nr:hypothetical protein [Candidatus Methanomethylophilaceae archaeon]
MCFFEQYPDDIVAVLFDRTNAEGVFGVADDSKPVYVDRYCGIVVSFGDTWDCRILLSKDGRFYLAWPLSKHRAVVEGGSTSVQSVTALGNDTIGSSLFESDRYVAYRSLDGTRLELRPDPRGDIVCREGTIRIPGIDRFIEQATPCALRHVFAGGRLTIELSQ